jgi:hypothetical protein
MRVIPLATQIIAALRTQPQLKGNTFLIATELAHRMNSSGFGRVSYQFLAWKAHCCRQTAVTHIAKLIDLGLITKTVLRTREGYAWNLYQYRGPRVHSASPPVTTHGPKGGRTLPPPEREKDTALREDLETQKKGLRFLTNPDSPMYQACLEKITALEALQRTS